jgi:hypothetical protein
VLPELRHVRRLEVPLERLRVVGSLAGVRSEDWNALSGGNPFTRYEFLSALLGMKFRLVKGYAANSDILLAVERKEVDGWAALATTIKTGVDRGAVRRGVAMSSSLRAWTRRSP